MSSFRPFLSITHPTALITWIRHPSYDFFVILKEGRNLNFTTEFGHDWKRKFLDTEFGYGWERRFLETKKMVEYAARWHQQYKDLRDDGVMEQLRRLLDRGEKLSQ